MCIRDRSYIPDEDLKKQLALAMSEEKMPDIAVVDSSDFQFLHHMKAFADLTDAIPELKEYNEKALEPCTIDGRIYGQPFGVNCTGTVSYTHLDVYKRQMLGRLWDQQNEEGEKGV